MKLTTQILKQNFIFVLLVALGGVLHASADNKKNDSYAIYGYDPVAYFTINKAKKGLDKYSYNWDGDTWLFSSSQHLEMFKSKPQKYLPQFNGMCANGLSDGHVIEADPENWRIIDGKLYLFFSQYGRNQWTGDVKQLINSAKETLNEN